jgi:hypothetical protein
MFKRARAKLDESRRILENLSRATDADMFRAQFNAFIASSRTVTNALQKEGCHIDGFTEWYEPKQTEMRNDRLMRFFHNARVDDFHKGEHQLQFSTYNESLSSEDFDPPLSPDAPLAMGADGVFRIYDQGTARERRVPVTEGRNFIFVSVKNPPTEHRGLAIKDRTPVAICELALRYLEDLVFEADQKFGKKAAS